MAENRVQLIIEAKDQASGTIQRVKGELHLMGDTSGIQSLNSALAQTESSLGSLGSTAGSAVGAIGPAFSSITGTAVAAAAAMAAIAAAAAAAAKAGTQYNSMMEDSRIGIAAMLASMGQFTDAQWRQLDGAEKTKAAYAMTNGVMQQLQRDNMNTAATYEQLSAAFQEALGPGLAANLNVRQIQQFTTAMVQAGSAMTVPLFQMGQEVRAILSGDIDQNARIAKTLQMTRAEIERAKTDVGGLFPYLMNKLKDFQSFGADTQKTYSGLLSNTKDALAKGLGDGTKTFFEAFKTSMQGVLNYLQVVNVKTGEMDINPAFLEHVQTLNDLLIGALRTAEFLVKAVDNIVLKPLDATWRAVQTVGATNSVPGGTPVANYDEQERLDTIKKIMADIIQQQQTIANWKPGDLFADISAAWANLNLPANIQALENWRERFKAAGQSTEELDKFLANLKNQFGDVHDGIMLAGNGLNNYSYAANTAAETTEQLKERIRTLKEQFRDLASIEKKVGESLQRQMLEAGVEVEASEKGWDPGRKAIEKQYAMNRELLKEYQKELTAAHVTGSEAERELYQRQMDVDKVYKDRLTAHEREQANKASAKTGKGSLSYADIDQSVARFESRVGKMYQELNDVGYQMWIDQEKAAGNYFRAEELSTELWLKNRKEAISENARATVQQYQEMVQKIEKAEAQGKASPEALAEKARSQSEIARIQAAAELQKSQAEQYARQKQQDLIRQADLKRIESVAQLQNEYAQLTGTIQDQSAAAVQLLEVERDRKLQEAGTTAEAQKQRDLINQIYNERIRLAQLQATGSSLDGFREGMRDIYRNMETPFRQGYDGAQLLKKGFDDVAEAAAECSMTGKVSVENLANSTIKQFLRMTWQMMVTDRLFKSIFSFLGLGGSPSFTSAGGVTWDPSMNFPTHHTGYNLDQLGLAPNEHIAVVENDEIILPKGSWERGGSASSIKTSQPASISNTFHVTVGAPSGNSESDKASATNYGMDIARVAEAEFTKMLQKQMRPGGLLNKGVNS